MMKHLKNLSIAGGLGIALAGCGNSGNGSVVLTPPPAAATYYQIERLSRPAVKEVFEPFVDHQKSNVSEPYNDPTILADIKATALALRPASATAGTNYGTILSGILYPDEYLVNLDGTTGGFLGAEVPALAASFGGRTPTDDVISLELGVVFGNTLQLALGVPEDNEENNCLATQNLVAKTAGPQPTAAFPYLAAAH
jgi:hypothetical protein